MQSHKITMLGTGLIGDFYTMTLHAGRSRDRVHAVSSRSEERGQAFSERWDIPEHTTSLEEAVNHPDTDVVSIPTAFGYSYEPGDAYSRYYGAEELIFPAADAPDVFALKTEMATLDVGGAQLAVEISALGEAGPQAFTVGSTRVVAVPSNGGARFFAVPDTVTAGDAEIAALAAEGAVGESALVVDGESWERIQSGQSFWFAWYATYPDTEWWPTGK